MADESKEDVKEVIQDIKTIEHVRAIQLAKILAGCVEGDGVVKSIGVMPSNHKIVFLDIEMAGDSFRIYIEAAKISNK